MKQDQTQPKTLIILTALCLFISIILWLSSYTHRTGVGIDHDIENKQSISHRAYRISWTGHGSIWIGFTDNKKKNSNQKLEKFDLAAIFFRRNNQPLSSSISFLNKIGFWYIKTIINTEKKSFWVGIPSWIPVLVFGLVLYFLYKRRRHTNSFDK